MSNTKKISNAEWLCAALIDLLPISTFERLTNYCLTTYYVFLSHNVSKDAIIDYTDVVKYLLSVAFVYLLFKDAFGGSLGKRIMGISLEKEGQDINIGRSLVRNFLPAICYAHCFTGLIGVHNIVMANLFVIYCIAELLCVRFTNKTIGDNLCGTELEKSDGFTPGKINNRNYCLITILLLLFFTKENITPVISNDTIQTSRDALRDLVQESLRCLVQIFCYSFVLYKLIKVTAFRWVSIILIGLPIIGHFLWCFHHFYVK
ncbi:MAG: RDD family protein [Paludibacteraceae bacterium]|nr:RDD family protein [Paludibacteraceae bacterium]